MRRFGDNFFIRSDYQEKSDDKYDCLKNCLFLMKQTMFLAGKDFPVAAKEFNSNEKTFQKNLSRQKAGISLQTLKALTAPQL